MTPEQNAAVERIRELLQIARFNSIEAVSVQVADELLSILDSLHNTDKKHTDEKIAQEFWLRGYAEAHIENQLPRPEMFEDGFSADWYDTYGAEFTEDGEFCGKLENLP